jgi:hypothetical protein
VRQNYRVQLVLQPPYLPKIVGPDPQNLHQRLLVTTTDALATQKCC